MAPHIDYFVSLNSPWTHLGAARLMAVAARHGATLRTYPVDFGTIFPASGGLPLPKRAPSRQAYRLQELERWRSFLEIPIQLKPRFFPAADRLASHCVIAVRETIGDGPATALAHCFLKALWEEEADTGDPQTLTALAAKTGLDGPALLRLAEQDHWEAMRLADSQMALDRGVFGAPSYVVGREVFWGQDRLDFLDRHLARG